MMTIVEYLDSKNRYTIDEPIITNTFYATFNVDNGTTIQGYYSPTTAVTIGLLDENCNKI